MDKLTGSTAVTVIDPARQALVIDKRTQMLSLPDWAKSLASMRGQIYDPAKGMIPILPSSYGSLTEAERTELETKIADLDLLLAAERCPVPYETEDPQGRPVVQMVTADQAKILMIGEMILAKASAPMSAEQAAAKARSYMEALDELPAWAVRIAISNWHKGLVRGVAESDFKWAPDSAVLRRACADVMRPYVEMKFDLKRILEAKPISQVA